MSAQDDAIPAAPTRWVTDNAHYLKASTVRDLDARLHDHERATKHQVIVYITPTTGSTPLEDWTEAAFHKWKVGRKGVDDGLILFVFPTDRRVRVQVGYGLEQNVPDVTAARIIRDDITPKFRAGDPDGGVVAGTDALLKAVDGQALEINTSPTSLWSCLDGETRVFLIVMWLIGVFPLIGIVSFVRAYLVRPDTHLHGGKQ